MQYGIIAIQMMEWVKISFKMYVQRYADGLFVLTALTGIRNMTNVRTMKHSALIEWMNFLKHTNYTKPGDVHITKYGNAGER